MEFTAVYVRSYVAIRDEPERTQGVMLSTALECVRTRTHVRTCIRTYVRVSARPAWERVKSVWLGTSAVWDLRSCAAAGWLRTSVEGQVARTRVPGSAVGQRSSRSSVSSLRSFYHCMLAMNIKFALEQPSGTGVGHELA